MAAVRASLDGATNGSTVLLRGIAHAITNDQNGNSILLMVDEGGPHVPFVHLIARDFALELEDQSFVQIRVQGPLALVRGGTVRDGDDVTVEGRVVVVQLGEATGGHRAAAPRTSIVIDALRVAPGIHDDQEFHTSFAVSKHTPAGYGSFVAGFATAVFLLGTLFTASMNLQARSQLRVDRARASVVETAHGYISELPTPQQQQK